MIPAVIQRTIWDELPEAIVDTQKLEHLFESRAKDLMTKVSSWCGTGIHSRSVALVSSSRVAEEESLTATTHSTTNVLPVFHNSSVSDSLYLSLLSLHSPFHGSKFVTTSLHIHHLCYAPNSFDFSCPPPWMKLLCGRSYFHLHPSF